MRASRQVYHASLPARWAVAALLLALGCSRTPPREAPASTAPAPRTASAPAIEVPEPPAAAKAPVAPVVAEPAVHAEEPANLTPSVDVARVDEGPSPSDRRDVEAAAPAEAQIDSPDAAAPALAEPTVALAGGPPGSMPPAVGAQADGVRPSGVSADPALSAAVSKLVSRSPLSAVLRAFYAGRGGAPAFVEGLTPTAAAADLTQLVADLPSHAIDPKAYAMDGFSLAARATPEEAALAEVTLSSALVRYVAAFRFLRRIHPFKFVAEEDLPEFWRKNAEPLAELSAAVLPSLRSGLEALWPARAEYAILRAALPVWRQKAEAEKARGKPPAVPIKRMDIEDAKSPKQKAALAKLVRTLQARLIFDGYLAGEATGLFDEATAAAVAAFQHRHNLTEDGRPGLDTLKRFRETTATKVAAIELSLQRWRESELLRDSPEDYIRVNLPGFRLELVEQGDRKRAHRVIVGNSKLDFSQDSWKQGFINRTPLLETRLYKVILNPTWIVPARIRDGEISEELGKDPNYLKKQGIHVRTMSDGSDKLVQSAGDHNVLGEVKFMLEKTDAVYLHDTNKRKFFDKSERALSHGCMRVDKAKDLAYYLASTRANISQDKVDSIIRDGRTTELLLERPIPVYTDYNTVGIDDAGELVFYIDVYGYDRAALNHDLPPATYARFGSGSLKPGGVPIIPQSDYVRLKAQGAAPLRWPPTAPTAAPAPSQDGP